MAKVGTVIRDFQAGQVNERSNSINTLNESPQNQLILGMRSKDAKTWINGPTHEIRNQALPGYTGFIPGVKSENVFSTTYSSNTAKSFENQIVKGQPNFDVNKPNDRFRTTQNEIYSPRSNRRIVENQEFNSRRDYLEYTIAVNNGMRSQRDAYLQAS